LPNHR